MLILTPCGSPFSGTMVVSSELWRWGVLACESPGEDDESLSPCAPPEPGSSPPSPGVLGSSNQAPMITESSSK